MKDEDENEDGSRWELRVVCCSSRYESALVVVPGGIVSGRRLHVSGGVELMRMMRLAGAVERRIQSFFFLQAPRRERDSDKEWDGWVGYGGMGRGEF